MREDVGWNFFQPSNSGQFKKTAEICVGFKGVVDIATSLQLPKTLAVWNSTVAVVQIASQTFFNL